MKQFDNAAATGGCVGDCWALLSVQWCSITGPCPSHVTRASLSLGSPNPTLFPPVPAKWKAERRSHILQESPPAMEGRRMEVPSLWVMTIFITKPCWKLQDGELPPHTGAPWHRLLGSLRTQGFLSYTPSVICLPQMKGLNQAGRQQFTACAPKASFFPWIIFIMLYLLFIPASFNQELPVILPICTLNNMHMSYKN